MLGIDFCLHSIKALSEKNHLCGWRKKAHFISVHHDSLSGKGGKTELLWPKFTTSQGSTATRLRCWAQLSIHSHTAESLSEPLRIPGFKNKTKWNEKSIPSCLWPFSWDQLWSQFEIWHVLEQEWQHSLAGACALWSKRPFLPLTSLILWFGWPVGTLCTYLKMHKELWDAITLPRPFKKHQQQKTFRKCNHIIIHFGCWLCGAVSWSHLILFRKNRKGKRGEIWTVKAPLSGFLAIKSPEWTPGLQVPLQSPSWLRKLGRW